MNNTSGKLYGITIRNGDFINYTMKYTLWEKFQQTGLIFQKMLISIAYNVVNASNGSHQVRCVQNVIENTNSKAEGFQYKPSTNLFLKYK